MTEPLSLIGLCYRFRKRMEYCLPYWLEQNVAVHICMTEDPDGARGVLFDLADFYPDKLHLHTFPYKPLQRAKMYHEVIRDIRTQYSAFFDLDNVPPPNLIACALSQITPELGMSVPRIHLREDQADSVLSQPRKSYQELYQLVVGQKLMHDSGKEMVGYFQLAETGHLVVAAEHSEYNGVNCHDTWIANRLGKECNLKQRAVDCEPMLHLGHPKFHAGNPGINL